MLYLPYLIKKDNLCFYYLRDACLGIRSCSEQQIGIHILCKWKYEKVEKPGLFLKFFVSFKMCRNNAFKVNE